MVQARSVVQVYVRHSQSCSSRHRGEFFRGCDCPKWLRYSVGGKRHRKPAKTRSWDAAEDMRVELQEQLDRGGAIIVRAEPETPTIEHCVETFISGKESEGLRKATIRKLRYQLAQFVDFMTARSRLFPNEVTATDVIEYRTAWDSWKSAVTRQKAQQNLRGFLRFACKKNLNDILDALKPVRLAREDKERLAPRPFTEKELKTLIAQVPTTFPDAKKAARVIALIHCMVATGQSEGTERQSVTLSDA